MKMFNKNWKALILSIAILIITTVASGETSQIAIPQLQQSQPISRSQPDPNQLRPRRRMSREEMLKQQDPNYSPDAYGIHDPVMIKQGDYYYVFSTNGGIKITRSKDMKNFERIGQVFTKLPDWMPEHIRGINSLWAPDISFRNGLYHLYYSASSFGTRNSLIGLMVNKTLDPASPDYKWIDKGIVTKSSEGMSYNAIDPNLIKDQSGQWYMSFGSFWTGIKLIRIGDNGLELDNTVKPIDLAERDSHAVEAPFIISRNGYYYLFVSFDLCCRGANSTYKIMVGRAKNIIGPYLDKDGIPMTDGGGSLILAAGETDRWKGPGHNAIFSENNHDYLIYHAYDSNISFGPSALHIRDLLWDKDKWPYPGEEINLQP